MRIEIEREEEIIITHQGSIREVLVLVDEMGDISVYVRDKEE